MSQMAGAGSTGRLAGTHAVTVPLLGVAWRGWEAPGWRRGVRSRAPGRQQAVLGPVPGKDMDALPLPDALNVDSEWHTGTGGLPPPALADEHLWTGSGTHWQGSQRRALRLRFRRKTSSGTRVGDGVVDVPSLQLQQRMGGFSDVVVEGSSGGGGVTAAADGSSGGGCNTLASKWQTLVALGLMYSLACFVNTVVETAKDTIIVTACGAECLPFLSACAVLPASMCMLAFHAWLRGQLSRRLVYYATLLPLALFYVLFATLLYPNAAALHFNGLPSSAFAAALPGGMQPLVQLAQHWTYTLFFALADLWGPVAISILFFGSATEVLSVEEAAVVYPLVGIVANLAVVLGGLFCSTLLPRLAGTCMGRSVQVMAAVAAAATALMCGCRAFLDTRVSAAKRSARGSSADGDAQGSNAQKRSVWDALGVVASSRRICSLFLFVASYGICYKLFEVSWKGQLAAVFPAAADYHRVLSGVQTAVGCVTLVSMLAARFIFARGYWGLAAATTPVVMLVCGGAFFGFSLAGSAGLGLPALGLSARQVLLGCVMLGGVVEVTARSGRYSLLEPAKELKYMQLDPALRDRGKASVDLLAAQVGKTGASVLIQALLLTCGSLASALPFVGITFAAVVACWLVAVRNLAAGDGAEEGAVGRELLQAVA